MAIIDNNAMCVALLRCVCITAPGLGVWSTRKIIAFYKVVSEAILDYIYTLAGL